MSPFEKQADMCWLNWLGNLYSWYCLKVIVWIYHVLFKKITFYVNQIINEDSIFLVSKDPHDSLKYN